MHVINILNKQRVTSRNVMHKIDKKLGTRLTNFEMFDYRIVYFIVRICSVWKFKPILDFHNELILLFECSVEWFCSMVQIAITLLRHFIISRDVRTLIRFLFIFGRWTMVKAVSQECFSINTHAMLFYMYLPIENGSYV